MADMDLMTDLAMIILGGNERGVGGRPGYLDEKSYGRFAHRSAGGYKNGISDLEASRGYADLPSVGSQSTPRRFLRLRPRMHAFYSCGVKLLREVNS